MNEQKLLPCPFCGEVPVEGYRRGADWHECESGEVYISCSSPEHEDMCLLVHGEDFEQAAKTWSLRTPLPENKPLTVGTNADRIRSMTNEELAVIIAMDCLGEKLHFCKNRKECDDILECGEIIPEAMCVSCVADWLSQPAEED